MKGRKVYLAPEARRSAAGNPERLEKKAEALAAALTLPRDVEFARFDHAGRTYALSARVIVEVDLMTSRVPDVVIRRGGSSARRKG
jgi:hypothetical protein